MGGACNQVSDKRVRAGIERGKIARALLTAWVVLAVALILALPYDAPTFRAVARTLGLHLLFSRAPAQSVATSPQMEWLSRYDPKPGTPAPQALVQAVGEDQPTRHHLIVYLGSCSACSLKFQPEESWFDQSPWYTAVALVDAGADHAKVREWIGPTARVVSDTESAAADPDRTIAFRLNAYFTPRVYLYGPDWRLVCVSRYGEGLDTFLARSRQR